MLCIYFRWLENKAFGESLLTPDWFVLLSIQVSFLFTQLIYHDLNYAVYFI